MSPQRRYWLMKTEPDTFSIDDLQRVGTEPWNGVRNYQARNHMRAMHPGDGVFLYHSSCPVPGIAGLATVASEAYPDPRSSIASPSTTTRRATARIRAGRWST